MWVPIVVRQVRLQTATWPLLYFTLLPTLQHMLANTHTHTHLTALCPGLPGWAGTRMVPIWILLKQETVSGSGINWAICKSAPRSRQITTPAPHHSVFYRLDALPAAQPTASKHWRQSEAEFWLSKVCEHWRRWQCNNISLCNWDTWTILVPVGNAEAL